MIPIYKEKKFSDVQEFKKWLNKTTYKVVKFKDLGQDLLDMYIAKNGEIIHCNLQSYIYNGRFINMNKLKQSIPIEIFENGKWVKKERLIIDKIINNDPKRTQK